MIETHTFPRQCFIALVMPARVGMSVGAVRCHAEAWVWPDVLALRGSGHIREGMAMRHNNWL